MFLTSDSQFHRQYFWSSQMPVFVLILLFIAFQVDYSEIFHPKRNILISPNFHLLIIEVILIGMIIYSIICLYSLINRLHRNRMLAAPANEEQKIITLSSEYNKGMLNFFLSLILPLITSFSIIDYPMISLTELLLIQLLIYFFFNRSSDFYPNIVLPLLGQINLFIGETKNKQKVYCFVEKESLNELIGKKVEVRYLTAGEYPPKQCICGFVKTYNMDGREN